MQKIEKVGVLYIIPSSIEQNENINFLIDEQKKLLHNLKHFSIQMFIVCQRFLRKINKQKNVLIV